MSMHETEDRKSIVSMGVILGSMPMVHLRARVLKDNYDGNRWHILAGTGLGDGGGR